MISEKIRINKIFLGFLGLLTLIIILHNNEAWGKYIADTVVSQSLKGNLLDDPFEKPMMIYLPPSYDEGTSRYPVIYYLHGFNTSPTAEWHGIPVVMDALIEQKKVKEMIVVMPNGSNKYGGSWYVNYSVAGNYEDYIVFDLVKFIDSKYRTLPQRESRAIGGGSMGGFGSMYLAMKHPDVFSSVVSQSGVLSLDKEKQMILNRGAVLSKGLPPLDIWSSIFLSMAIAFSPNPNSKMLYDYPADENGNLIDDVWQRWLKYDPTSLAKTHQDNLRLLRGIYFDNGKFDGVVSIQQARDFDQALTEAGITHVYEEYEGDHNDKWIGRLYNIVPLLSTMMDSENVKSVNPHDKNATKWGELKSIIKEILQSRENGI